MAPAPLLTITLEPADGERGDADIHLHPGGQGFWTARLIERLGVDVTLCATFGGESGRVVRGLLEEHSMSVRSVETAARNGAYVDDRRSGERQRMGTTCATALTRHEIDDLYGVTLVEALKGSTCVLGGPGPEATVPADMYRRLAADITANGQTLIADLSGEFLDAALRGGTTIMKVSHEELLREHRARDASVGELLAAMAKLSSNGQRAVVCSRAEEPALAWFDGRAVEVRAPLMQAMDSRGAGDSFTAGMTAALARDQSFEQALRLGAAAGALNATRRGLGTGHREEIEQLAAHVEVTDLAPQRGAAP